ncbi:MAG: LLM class flavin-dependent oxidoreductase [Chloroflexota bacterium]
MTAGNIGITLKMPYDQLGEYARRAEDAGFSTVWVSETSRDSMIQAAVVLQSTDTVDVGTSITVAFPRSPTVTAMQAWDLDEIGGGRFILGLGSQVRRIIEERYSAEFDRPAARMAEYIQAMRAVWGMEQGERTTFEGEIYRVLRPSLSGYGSSRDRSMPRVHVAAVGPLMTRAAATYADGILGHPFTSVPYLLDHVIPKVEEALGRAGRSRNEFAIRQGVITSVSDDREQAYREAKLQIAFYGTTPNYRPVFASCGDGHLTDVLRDTWKRSKQNPDALIDVMPDEAVERYAVAGTPAEVRDRLAEIVQHADEVMLGSVWWQIDSARMAENNAAIIETFAGRSPRGTSNPDEGTAPVP